MKLIVKNVLKIGNFAQNVYQVIIYLMVSVDKLEPIVFNLMLLMAYVQLVNMVTEL